MKAFHIRRPGFAGYPDKSLSGRQILNVQYSVSIAAYMDPDFLIFRIFQAVAYPIPLRKPQQDPLILRLSLAAVSAPVGFSGVAIRKEQCGLTGSAENGSRTAPALDILRIIGSGRNFQRRSACQCADDLRVVFSILSAPAKNVRLYKIDPSYRCSPPPIGSEASRCSFCGHKSADPAWFCT